MVNGVGYDPETKKLRVAFRAATYDYYDVEPEEYEKLIGAESVGKHFLERIKPCYSCERYEEG